jgi:hypothetical protein
MKITLVALMLVVLSLLIVSVSAQWSALNSGYAVTTDYHGVDILPGTVVTATAGTTDANVRNVTFVWKYPNGTEAFIDPQVPVEFKGNYWTNNAGSFPIYEATSSYRVVLPIGDWGVQAFFNGAGGHLQGQGSDTIKIRATSFNAVPDVPIVGTAGAVAAMFLGLGLFLKRKKRQH